MLAVFLYLCVKFIVISEWKLFQHQFFFSVWTLWNIETKISFLKIKIQFHAWKSQLWIVGLNAVKSLIMND